METQLIPGSVSKPKLQFSHPCGCEGEKMKKILFSIFAAIAIAAFAVTASAQTTSAATPVAVQQATPGLPPINPPVSTDLGRSWSWNTPFPTSNVGWQKTIGQLDYNGQAAEFRNWFMPSFYSAFRPTSRGWVPATEISAHIGAQEINQFELPQTGISLWKMGTPGTAEIFSASSGVANGGHWEFPKNWTSKDVRGGTLFFGYITAHGVPEGKLELVERDLQGREIGVLMTLNITESGVEVLHSVKIKMNYENGDMAPYFQKFASTARTTNDLEWSLVDGKTAVVLSYRISFGHAEGNNSGDDALYLGVKYETVRRSGPNYACTDTSVQANFFGCYPTARFQPEQ